MTKLKRPDNCEGALKVELEWSSVRKMGNKRGRDMEEREVSDVVDLKEMIRELKEGCTMCWTNGKMDVGRHELPRCRYI